MNSDSIHLDLNQQKSYIIEDASIVTEFEFTESREDAIDLSESRDIIELPQSRSAPVSYTEYAQCAPSASRQQQSAAATARQQQRQLPMWAMQPPPPQPYIPQNASEEHEIPINGGGINIGRAKIRSPNGGSTHFNVFFESGPSFSSAVAATSE